MCGSGETQRLRAVAAHGQQMVTHVCLSPLDRVNAGEGAGAAIQLALPEGRVPRQGRLDPGWQVVSIIPQSPRHPSQSLLPWVGADTLHQSPRAYPGARPGRLPITMQLTRMIFPFSSDAGAGDPKRRISSHGNDRKSVFQCPEIKLYWHMATTRWPLTPHRQG